MSQYLPGTRVIAMSHTEDDVLYIFGFGVYEGDFLRPGVDLDAEVVTLRTWEENELAKPGGIMREIASLTGKPPAPHSDDQLRQIAEQMNQNPRIRLDNGKIVWGYECWWGNAGDFENSPDKSQYRKIIEIDIDEQRAKFKRSLN